MKDKLCSKAKVQKIDPINSSIKLEEHKEEWEEIYRQEKGRIQRALKGKKIEIHHVGSTSIKDLLAKPLVDMLLLVEDSSKEEDWFQHRMFKHSKPEINLHVFSKGCKEAERMLVFRDWLRKNKQDRKAYESLKKDLAAKEWQYVQDYADQKTSLVEEILKNAFENS